MTVPNSPLSSYLPTGSRQSIIKTLTSAVKGSGEDLQRLLKDVFATNSPAIHRWVTETLIGLGNWNAVAACAFDHFPPDAGAWRALHTLTLRDLCEEHQESALSWAERLLKTEFEELQSANARFICQCLPQLRPALIREIAPSTLRVVVMFAQDNEVEPIIKACRTFYDTLPTVLGLALSPQRLLQLSTREPELAERLAQRHGYTSDVTLSEAVLTLQLGVRHVDASMLTRTAEEVRADVSEIMHAILRETGATDSKPVSQETTQLPDFSQSRYAQAVLFAAVRELDTASIEARRLASPNDFTQHKDLATNVASFMHVPKSLLRTRLIDDACSLADQCFVPEDWLSQFIVEHAATSLATTNEQRDESELFLRARWRIMAHRQRWTATSCKPKRLGKTIRFPASLSLVVPPERLLFSNDADSPPVLRKSACPAFDFPCESAIQNLVGPFSSSKQVAELSDALQRSSDVHAIKVVPLGVEIQIPIVCDNQHIAWKELFRSAGIASQRRLECGRMLEASLPPAASTLPIRRFLEFIIEQGIVGCEQDLGIHVSLQGDLGEDAAYLAFPQLFLNNPMQKTRRPRHAMRLVMSKGLVRLNSDVRTCTWAAPASFRTELRVFICGVKKNGRLEIDPTITEAIRETHLIGSAMLSDEQELKAIAADYRKSIGACIDRFPIELIELLNSNFYEATGDYRDATMLDHVDIVKRLEAARHAIDQREFSELRDELSKIRTDAANRIATKWGIVSEG